jgi:hypothetical protein
MLSYINPNYRMGFMQKPACFFTRPSWIVSVALALAPVALWWTALNELPFLSRHTFGGHILGRDFANYWMGARLFLTHRIDMLFDPALYTRAVTAMWGGDLHMLSFSYPPSMLPLIGWLGLLPYPAALALWTVLGLAALFAAAWPYSKTPLVAAAILASGAVLACIDDGQNGLFTSALIVAALTRLDRRPALAGVLIGLLTVKPHLGLLLPVALLAARRWRVIWSASASALCLFAFSLLVAGPEAWRLYLEKTAPYQGYLFRHSEGMWQAMTPSPAVATITAGGSWSLAWIVQGVATTAAVALVATLFARRAKRPIGDLDRVVLVAATFLASPYSFNYDMGALAVFLLIASVSKPELDQSAWWRWGAVLLWSAPIVMVLVGVRGVAAHHPWPPVGSLMVVAGLGLVVRASVVLNDQHVSLGLKMPGVRIAGPARGNA